MSPDDIPIIPQTRPKRCQRRTGIDTGGGPGGSRGRGEASPALTPLGKGGRASGRPQIPSGCCLSVPRRERQHRRGRGARSAGKGPAGGRGRGKLAPSVPRRAPSRPFCTTQPSPGCRLRCDLPRPRSSPAAPGQPCLWSPIAAVSADLWSLPAVVTAYCGQCPPCGHR